MSHDQKPGRMRLVSSSAVPQRRGDNLVPVPEAASALNKAAGPEVAAADAVGRRRTLLLSLIFIMGCAFGGAALPMLGAL